MNTTLAVYLNASQGDCDSAYDPVLPLQRLINWQVGPYSNATDSQQEAQRLQHTVQVEPAGQRGEY